jgi:hypothetical protein
MKYEILSNISIIKTLNTTFSVLERNRLNPLNNIEQLNYVLGKDFRNFESREIPSLLCIYVAELIRS